jgi:hypothetical protein
MEWLRRIRAGLGMGLTWAIGWGLVGVGIEIVANFVPALNGVDMWIQTLAIPGFLGGVVFSGVLRVAGFGRKFEELSAARFAAWGAVGGAVLGGVAIALGLGSGSLVSALAICGTTAVLSAASAVGTLALARWGQGAPSALEGGAGESKRLGGG